MNYGNAVTFCKDRNSSLIEINSPEQMNYAIQKLNNISEKVDWNKYYTYYTYKWKGWWGGATEKEDNVWIWTESGTLLVSDSFVWGPGQPNDHDDLKLFWFSNQSKQV